MKLSWHITNTWERTEWKAALQTQTEQLIKIFYQGRFEYNSWSVGTCLRPQLRVCHLFQNGLPGNFPGSYAWTDPAACPVVLVWSWQLYIFRYGQFLVAQLHCKRSIFIKLILSIIFLKGRTIKLIVLKIILVPKVFDGFIQTSYIHTFQPMI